MNSIEFRMIRCLYHRASHFLANLKLSRQAKQLYKMPLAEIDPNIQSKPGQRPKPGPKPKTIYELPLRAYAPAIRPTHHRHKRIIVKVLHFLLFHRVFDPWSRLEDKRVIHDGNYRSPYFKEAAVFFDIPPTTISRWWHKKDSFGLSEHRSWSPRWPDLETALFDDFLKQRDAGKIVTTSWFRTQAQIIWKQQNPTFEKLFTFSNGWWAGFRKRHNIVIRRITKQATKRPAEYLAVALSFLRFIKRVSQGPKPNFSMPGLLNCSEPRFALHCIINLDETPIPFEYLDGRTWDLKGNKTISGKADRSGWNKRQATLILYIFADGLFRHPQGHPQQGQLRLKPKLIFKGSPTGDLWRKENSSYHPDVTVEFNETAYNNEGLFLQWIEKEYKPLLQLNKEVSNNIAEDNLLVLDVASFYKTDAIKAAFKDNDNKVITAMIPPGLTSLLQPLDTAINGPFKRWLRDEAMIFIVKREEEGKFDWSVLDKRIMITHIVAGALKTLETKADIVAKSFKDCGISINPDGSEDFKIKLKDIPNDIIDFTGWETEQEPIIKQEQLVPSYQDVEEVIVAGDDDEQELRLSLMTNKDLQQLLKAAHLS